MPYFHYRQNNSGGRFTGPAINLYIEADNVEEANNIFLTLDGCYFDPEYERDCSCCGSRWSEPWDDVGISSVYDVLREIDKDSNLAASWASFREITNKTKIHEYLIREKSGILKVI